MDAIVFHDTSWGNESHIPVAKGLNEAGYTLIVRDYKSDKSYLNGLKDAGITCLDWGDFISEETRAAAKKEAAQRLDALLSHLKDPAVQQGFASPLGNVLAKRAEAFFRQLLDRLTGQIVEIEALKHISRAYQLHLIVLGYDHLDHSRSVIAWAKKHGVATLGLSRQLGRSFPAVLHPLLQQRPETRQWLANDAPNGAPAFFADMYAVDGPAQIDRFTQWGGHHERFFVTGSVSLDRYYPRERRTDEYVFAGRKSIGLDPERPVVLACCPAVNDHVFSFPTAIRFVRAFLASLREAQRLSNAQFIIVPRDSETKYLKSAGEKSAEMDALFLSTFNERGIRDVLVWRGQIDRAMAAATLAIVPVHLPVVPQLILADVPVVGALMDKQQQSPYDSDSGIVLVDDPAKLAPTVHALLNDRDRLKSIGEKQAAYLPRINFNDDGKAGERLKHLILKLVSRKLNYKAAQWELELRALEKKAGYEDLIQQKLASLLIKTD